MADRKVSVGVRLGEAGVGWLDTIAKEESNTTGMTITRTEVVKISLVVARLHEREVRSILRRRMLEEL